MSKPGMHGNQNNPFKRDNRNYPHQGNPNNRDNNKRNSGNFNNHNNVNNSSTTNNKQQQAGNQTQNANQGQGNKNEQRHNQTAQPPKKETEIIEKVDEKEIKDNVNETTTTTTTTGSEKKFTGRCRLFVGNLTPDITDDEFKKLFEPYGEISEVYVNSSRGFGFIRLDYRHNAEAAKAALDGLQRKGRVLRVRFATHGAALKVKNLHPYVSNELLEQSFAQFGDIERCIVIVDDRGKSTGEGIVEFERKPGATSALRRITEGVFLLGADPRPIVVEPLEQKDEEDGMPEKFLTKTAEYKKEREKDPRFAPFGTFEYEFGMRWKQLEELEKQRIEQVKKDTEEGKERLESEMQDALIEFQAEQIRKNLVKQQEELRRLEEHRNADRQRRQEQLEIRRQENDRERAQAEERQRADMMMSMRQQDMSRGRGPMDPLRQRDEMMMGDRFGDRMSERRDRPFDRMNDRPPGMMWQDDKSRGEGLMRGEPQRGREMRGPGAPPLQPPPIPPSGAMDRGGPVAAAAAAVAAVAAAQNSKSSPGPKPLMQSGAGGPNNQSDNPMEQDNALDENRLTSSPIILTSDLVSKKCSKESTASLSCSNSPSLSIKKDLFLNSTEDFDNQNKEEDGLWITDSDYRIGVNHSPTREHAKFMSPSVGQGSRDSPGKNYRGFLNLNGDYLSSPSMSKSNSNILSNVIRSQSEERVCSSQNSGNEVCSLSTSRARSEISSDIEMKSVERNERLQSGTHHLHQDDPKSYISCSEESYKTLSSDCKHAESQNQHQHDHSLQRYFSFDSSSASCLDLYQSNEEYEPSRSHRRPLSCPTLKSAESYEYEPNFANSNDDVYMGDIESSVHEENVNLCKDSSLCHKSKTASYSQKQTDSYNASHSDDSDGVLESGSKHFQQANESVKYNCNSSDVHNFCVLDSSYNQQTETSTELQEEHLSSYKQHPTDEYMEDDDVRLVTLPDVYQSYKEDIVATHVQNANLVDVISSEDNKKSSGNFPCPTNNSAISQNDKSLSENSVASQAIKDHTLSSATYTSTQNTVTEASSSLVHQNSMTSSSSSIPSSTGSALETHAIEDNQNDGALRTGDQNFKSGARQSASNTFIATPRSGLNPSVYAGAAMIQGIRQPGMMSSTAMHFAQHPGGRATIMRQQSLSTAGMRGPGVASHSTLVQQHALTNGVQSKSVFQQRTMTNGNQTMMVQQRTMTTGLGGMTQQTVVQQRLAPAAALRQHSFASQTGILPQSAVRLAQTRMLGAPMLQAQRLARPGFVSRPGGGATLIGPSIMRGAGQTSMMQQMVRQRYLGGPVMSGRGVQIVAGRPVRIRMTRDALPMDSNS